jgi:hypothetical protein
VRWGGFYERRADPIIPNAMRSGSRLSPGRSGLFQ